MTSKNRPMIVALLLALEFCLLSATSTGNETTVLDPVTVVQVRSTGCRTENVCVKDRDQIWTIDLRNAHLCETENGPGCTQLVDGCWKPRQLEDLVAANLADLEMPTLLYLHGNRTDSDWAETRGLQTYSNLFGTWADRPSVRMVIVKWRSDPEVKCITRDFEIKSRRAVSIGNAFNEVLEQFHARPPILMGYSLGAQIIISALESEPDAAENGECYRVVLVAPAIDCGFLSCRSAKCTEVCRVTQTMVFENNKDFVINYAKRLCERRCGNLAEYRALLQGQGPVPLGKVSHVDISCELGQLHSIVKYTQSPTLIRMINGLIKR